jgi:O-antigen biosynthesis protein WbqL
MVELAKIGIEGPVAVPITAPEYFKETLKSQLPTWQVIEYNPWCEVLRARRVVMPAMLHKDYVFHRNFRDFVARYAGTETVAASSSAIFVSRSSLTNQFRRLVNAEAVEDIARGLGLDVVRPETMSWVDQVRLFSGARLIVGEFGSGMHNAIFSRVGTRVVCLNAVNHVQSRIANSFGHDLGYLLDRDGLARRFEPNWAEQQTFAIDLRDFEQRVISALAA